MKTTYILFLSVLICSSCQLSNKKTSYHLGHSIEDALNSKSLFQRFSKTFEGCFENRSEDIDGSEMVIVDFNIPIWREEVTDANWFYVESVIQGFPDQPFYQTFLEVRQHRLDTLEIRYYGYDDFSMLRGAYLNPNRLNSVSQKDLNYRPGCRMLVSTSTLDPDRFHLNFTNYCFDDDPTVKSPYYDGSMNISYHGYCYDLTFYTKEFQYDGEGAECYSRISDDRYYQEFAAELATER